MTIKTVAVFIGLLALSAFLFWLGGFNFDRRGEDVAFSTLIVIFAACFLTGIWAGITEEYK